MLPFEDETAVIEPELPLPEGKTSFKPDELYRFTRIKPFVLRFWESEFPSLKRQNKGAEGLAYTRADVQMILAIKRLLYDEGLTLPEARERLAGEDDQALTKAGSAVPKKAAKKKTVAKPVLGMQVSEETGGDAPKTRKRTDSATPATASKLPDKSRNKRGLPGDGGSRSRVSLEELLPGNGSATAAGTDRSKSKKDNAQTPTLTPPTADTETRAMRRKLSAALRELREILTFLHKGGR